MYLMNRKSGSMRCAWRLTGNPNAPLACVWLQPKAEQAAAVPPSSPESDLRRILLYA
jgi:hypothetical protein